MLIHNAEISGSLLVNWTPYNTGSFSGSFTGDGSQLSGITGATTASYVEYTNVANKPPLVSGSGQISFNGITDKPTLVSGSSQITYSGLTDIPSGIVSGSSQVSFNGITDKPTLVSGSSQITYSGLTGIPSGIVSGSSQVSYTGLSNIPSGIVSSSTQVAGYNIFATTGSNTFQGSQTVTGSLFVSQNLIVAGSSSIQYISSSVVDIADNIITVNAFNPGTRFGGLAVADSGSSPRVSGSLLFDSIKDQWVFVHETPTAVTSSILLMGPETYNDLGNETYISANRLPKGSGIEHLRDSNITDTGTRVSINSNTEITGSLTVTTSGTINGVTITTNTASQTLTNKTIAAGSNTITGLTNSNLSGTAGITNANLANSTISGVALGSNLATLTIGAGLSGTSYNGSTGITIASTDTLALVTGRGASTSTDLTFNGTLTMGTGGTQFIRMGRFPSSTTNSGEAWIGRASDRSAGTMTVQLGTGSDRTFEVVDHAWSTVIFGASMNAFTYKGNVILHAGNYNSYSPTLTGGGASGTWSINVTGNAATATNASNASSISNAVGSSYTWTGAQYFRSNLGSTSGALSSPPLQAYSTDNNSAFMSFHKGGHYAVNMGLDSDNVLRIGGWSAAANRWQLDMSGNVYVAGSSRAPIFYDLDNTGYYLDPASNSQFNTGTFNGRMKYSDYLVSNNSGGLMGDYNINGTSSKVIWTIGESWPLANMYGLAYEYGSGYDHHLALKNNGTTYSRFGFIGGAFIGGTATAGGDFRAPIFYDSNDTGFYIDPNSTSVLSRGVFTRTDDHAISVGTIRGRAVGSQSGDYIMMYERVAIGSPVGWGSRGAPTYGLSTYGGADLATDTGFTTSGGSMRSPIFYDSNNTSYYTNPAGASVLSDIILYGNNYINNSSPTVYFQDTDNRSAMIHVNSNIFYVLRGSGTNSTTWSTYNGYWPLELSLETNNAVFGGNISAPAGDMRAPIFYDSGDTGYYLNLNGSSYLYALVLSGNNYLRPNTWIQLDGNYGLYWPNSYGAHFNPNTVSSYTQLATQGSKNSYGGLYDYYSAVNGIMYDSAGNGGVYREANGRWYFYYNLGNDCMGIGTSSTSSTYSLYLNKGVYAQSRIDATIYYDASNTAYYLDPNGGSYLAGSLEIANGYVLTNGVGGTIWVSSAQGSFGGYVRFGQHAVFESINGGYNFYVLDASGVGVVKTSGSQSWAAHSDSRIKTIHSVMENNLSKLESISPIYYSFNYFEDNRNRIGLIAQEVQEHFPELVATDPKTDYLTLDYTGLIPVLLGAIKELKNEIEILKTQL